MQVTGKVSFGRMWQAGDANLIIEIVSHGCEPYLRDTIRREWERETLELGTKFTTKQHELIKAKKT